MFQIIKNFLVYMFSYLFLSQEFKKCILDTQISNNLLIWLLQDIHIALTHNTNKTKCLHKGCFLHATTEHCLLLQEQTYLSQKPSECTANPENIPSQLKILVLGSDYNKSANLTLWIPAGHVFHVCF